MVSVHVRGESCFNRLDEFGHHSVDILDQAEKATLNIFVAVFKQLLDVLVELEFDCNGKPLRIHLEEEQVGEDNFSSNHDALVIDEGSESSVEGFFFLQLVVQFFIRTCQSDYQHRYERLLNPWRTI